MSGFYKILANKALDESLMGALKFRVFCSLCANAMVWPHPSGKCVKLEQILKFMSEHITALNLVASFASPRFSSLLRRVSKVLKFAQNV